MSIFLNNTLRTHGNMCILAKRMAAHYNKDWKMGPYPTNAEERAAAAKKYGLRPDDYMPYPDDGNAPGDYPYIKPFSLDHRDPFEFYDYFPARMNYKEPLQLHQELYREGWIDPDALKTYGSHVTWPHIFFWTFFPFMVFYALVYAFNQYKGFHPIMPKQFPYEGETHYLFEEPD